MLITIELCKNFNSYDEEEKKDYIQFSNLNDSVTEICRRLTQNVSFIFLLYSYLFLK